NKIAKATGTTTKTKTVIITFMKVQPPSARFKWLTGPTKPLNPNPALIGVPWILKMAAKAPSTAALHITGSIIFGLAKTLGMDIFGDPIKWARDVPTELTLQPATAKPNPAATTPKFPAPEPIPAKDTARAIPTVVIGVVIKIENRTAIKIPIIIGCNVSNCSTKDPINVVILPTNGSSIYPNPPPIIKRIGGIKMIL